jgi:hypothetical protein
VDKSLLHPQLEIPHGRIPRVDSGPDQQSEYRARPPRRALESIERTAEARVSDLPFRIPVYANDVSWQFDVGIRGRYLDRSDLHATGIRALPSFEEVTPVRIVRIDRETEGTPLVAGIRGIDFEALSVVCRRRRADDDA